MLKKFVKIFCYMGLFFYTSIVYGAVPNDYGVPSLQRTPFDTTNNYANWCNVFSDSATSTRTITTGIDSNNLPYYQYIQYGIDGLIWNHSDHCNINYRSSIYQTPPLASFMPDYTAGYNWYIISSHSFTNPYQSGDRVYSSPSATWYTWTGNVSFSPNGYVDVSPYDNDNIYTKTKTLSYSGISYDISKIEGQSLATTTGGIAINNSGVPANIEFNDSSGTSEYRIYAVIYTDTDLYSEIVTPSDIFTYLQNINFYAPTNIWTSSSTSYLNNDCPTCTRIIETNPYNNEVVSSGEPSFPYVVDYYISEDDFDDASIAYIRYPYISVTVSNGSVNETQFVEILSSGNHEYVPTFSNVTANGTYQVTIELKTKFYSNFLENLSGTIIPSNKSYINDVRAFYVGTTTRSSANGDYYVVGSSGGLIYSAYSGITCSMNLLGVLNADWWTCAMEYIVATLVPNNETSKTYMMEKLDTLLYLPPWGYVTYVNSLFGMTDTQTLPFIAISFPEGSPLRGSTLNLDLTSNLQNTTSFLSSSTPETMTDDTLTTFLYYWEMMWYVMFGWWFISEMFNSFGSSPIRTSFEDRKRYKKQQRIDSYKQNNNQ